MSRMPIAIAHDYLTQRGGAERVVLVLAQAFPEAPIYTTLYDPEGTYPEFQECDVRTSWLNRSGLARRSHRAALPLLPAASSSLTIDADMVVASSSGWAHGFPATGKKLVYCYSPPRWLYEPASYLGPNPARGVSLALRAMSPWLRNWDRKAAASADRYLAISRVSQERVQTAYGRNADILPAPHSVVLDQFQPVAPANAYAPETDYFLVVSRLLPYKNVKSVVEAFALRPEFRLVVIGAGPQKSDLQRTCSSNVSFRENLSDREMAAAYAGCKALIAASHEDFGLTPLEAAAHGKPSAVLRRGGFLETVVEDVTGVFFDSPDALDIVAALDRLLDIDWDVAALQARADMFDEKTFVARIRHEVEMLAETASETPTHDWKSRDV